MAATPVGGAEKEAESEGVDVEAGLETMEDFASTESGSEDMTPLEPAHAFSLLQPAERHPSPDVPSDISDPEPGTAPLEPAVHQPSPSRDDEPLAQAPHDHPDPDQER